MSDTETTTDRYAAPGDAERFAHYFWHPEPGRMTVIITEARINGTPITALCGRRLVPQRDPSRFPLCPECAAIKRRAQEHRDG